jgi:hypothetical protein
MTVGLAVQKLLNIDFFTENKIKNIAENFGGIGMCLWSCWKDLDEHDSERERY